MLTLPTRCWGCIGYKSVKHCMNLHQHTSPVWSFLGTWLCSRHASTWTAWRPTWMRTSQISRTSSPQWRKSCRCRWNSPLNKSALAISVSRFPGPHFGGVKSIKTHRFWWFLWLKLHLGLPLWLPGAGNWVNSSPFRFLVKKAILLHFECQAPLLGISCWRNPALQKVQNAGCANLIDSALPWFPMLRAFFLLLLLLLLLLFVLVFVFLFFLFFLFLFLFLFFSFSFFFFFLLLLLFLLSLSSLWLLLWLLFVVCCLLLFVCLFVFVCFCFCCCCCCRCRRCGCCCGCCLLFVVCCCLFVCFCFC